MAVVELCKAKLQDVTEKADFIYGYIDGDSEYQQFLEDLNNISVGFVVRRSQKIIIMMEVNR